MAKEEITPREWQIMEVLWQSDVSLTSSEVIQRMEGNTDMSPRTIRVLMNRLSQKDVLGYTVDERDTRVYHYFPRRPRAECVKEKSERFVQRYFSGNKMSGVVALLQSFVPTDEQIQELEDILEKSRGRKG